MSLNLIKREELNKIITKDFSYPFTVEKAGIYAIVVGAKAKSWFQNTIKFISFFRDDNLAVKINGIEFPKLSGERGEFDGEASWNGNKIKGLRQVNLFVVHLEKGEQNLEFIAKGSPLLESIEIHQIIKNQFFIDPATYLIEDGNRRPWFNILTNGVGIISIRVKAIASVGKDDNDLQIRINGLREQNNQPKAHKYWFWCGRVLKGLPRIFRRTLNLKPGFNYIEFWADGAPVFNELDIHVTMSSRIPSVDDPAWTGDFYDDSEEMILARLVFGEARSQIREAKIWVASVVPNRIDAKTWWGSTIHDVILKDQQFESFNKDNKNRSFIENPLIDSNQKQSWRDSYEVAKGILNGDISVSPEVTHFHDPRLSQEYFIEHIIPKGKFLKRVGNLYFYWSPN